MSSVCDVSLWSIRFPGSACVLKLTWLGREERPGSWEAERVSAEIKGAAAGVRGGDSRESNSWITKGQREPSSPSAREGSDGKWEVLDLLDTAPRSWPFRRRWGEKGEEGDGWAARKRSEPEPQNITECGDCLESPGGGSR